MTSDVNSSGIRPYTRLQRIDELAKEAYIVGKVVEEICPICLAGTRLEQAVRIRYCKPSLIRQRTEPGPSFHPQSVAPGSVQNDDERPSVLLKVRRNVQQVVASHAANDQGLAARTWLCVTRHSPTVAAAPAPASTSEQPQRE